MTVLHRRTECRVDMSIEAALVAGINPSPAAMEIANG
jgi:hypothetical protein